MIIKLWGPVPIVPSFSGGLGALGPKVLWAQLPSSTQRRAHHTHTHTYTHRHTHTPTHIHTYRRTHIHTHILRTHLPVISNKMPFLEVVRVIRNIGRLMQILDISFCELVYFFFLYKIKAMLARLSSSLLSNLLRYKDKFFSNNDNLYLTFASPF